MHYRRIFRARSPLGALLPLISVLCLASPARADRASDAFDAWSAAFTAQSNGQTFYNGYPAATAPSNRPAGWADALAIELAEDVYERRHTNAHRKLIDDLVTSFLTNDGATSKDWCLATYSPTGGEWKDGWNDDLGWMMTALVHAYRITGNTNFLTVATETWNCTYDRGWDTQYAAGGIWELMNAEAPTFQKPSKCALSNDPIIINGVLLYQITGDATYLTKSKTIYAWVRDKLFDKATGEVHGCWTFDGQNDLAGHLDQHDDNAYNDGTFLQAAVLLYRFTGDASYKADALLAIKSRVAKDAILHSGSEGSDSEWAYPFVKGLGALATLEGTWSDYETWLTNNANAAWSKRDSLGVTWNDWTTTTPDPIAIQSLDGCKSKPHPATCDLTPLDTRSAAGIWQFLPQSDNPNLAYIFEIDSAKSGLSLTIGAGANDAGAAPPIVQRPFTNDVSSLWTFVATGGGYYRIQSVAGGSFMSVEPNAGQPGARVLALASNPSQGNDRWLPVDNGDGTYSFYNLSTLQALDDPAASTAPDVAFEQWIGNGQDNQKFRLVRQAAPSPVDAGVADAGHGQGPVPVPTPDNDAGAGGATPGGPAASGCAAATAKTSSNAPHAAIAFGLGIVAMRRRRRESRRISGQS